MAIYPVGNTIDLCLEGRGFQWAYATDHKVLERRDAGRDIFRISCCWIFRVLCRHMPCTTCDRGVPRRRDSRRRRAVPAQGKAFPA